MSAARPLRWYEFGSALRPCATSERCSAAVRNVSPRKNSIPLVRNFVLSKSSSVRTFGWSLFSLRSSASVMPRVASPPFPENAPAIIAPMGMARSQSTGLRPDVVQDAFDIKRILRAWAAWRWARRCLSLRRRLALAHGHGAQHFERVRDALERDGDPNGRNRYGIARRGRTGGPVRALRGNRGLRPLVVGGHQESPSVARRCVIPW